MHYQRWKKYGDVTIVRSRKGTHDTTQAERLESARQRFWANTNKTDGCWLWTGKPGKNGYGALQVDGKKIYAHRFSFWLHNQYLPDFTAWDVVEHQCQNRLCVNPEHLRQASQKQNVENTSMRHDNKSGYRGVHWSKAMNAWKAEVGHNGTYYLAGYFQDVHDAGKAVLDLRLKLYTHNEQDKQTKAR